MRNTALFSNERVDSISLEAFATQLARVKGAKLSFGEDVRDYLDAVAELSDEEEQALLDFATQLVIDSKTRTVGMRWVRRQSALLWEANCRVFTSELSQTFLVSSLLRAAFSKMYDARNAKMIQSIRRVIDESPEQTKRIVMVFGANHNCADNGILKALESMGFEKSVPLKRPN